MKYGEAKWILYPIGVKVRRRIMTDNDVGDLIDRYGIPITNDDSGITSLKLLLIDLNYFDYDHTKDIIDWRIESLDPDWKTEYLDEIKDFYGEAQDYDEWFCEKDTFESQEEKDDSCKTKISQLKSSGTRYTDKGLVEEFCKSTGRGSVIPLFLAEFQDNVKWIESHLTHTLQVKTKRGTNPNSLKNLIQNQNKQGVTS